MEPQPEKLEPRVTKTDVISKDKDGTLEKVYFAKEARTVKRDDGTEYTKLVEPWEIRAKGKKKVKELRGAFKESAPQIFHENWEEWKRIGEETITKPDGTTDVVRADKLEMYRQMPGYCVHATRPTFALSGFGRMKAEGIVRQKIKWSREGKITETVYADGRKTSVWEETKVG